MIPHAFRTTVTVTVPVLVHGNYDKHGDFHVDDVQLQYEKNKDMMSLLSQGDLEELKDEALGQYQESAHMYGLEVRAEMRANG